MTFILYIIRYERTSLLYFKTRKNKVFRKQEKHKTWWKCFYLFDKQTYNIMYIKQHQNRNLLYKKLTK